LTAIRERSTPLALLHSAGAASLSSLWRMGVTFATHMALRRMIAPAEMGVWTWAEPIFILLAQVRDLGVPGHVVRQSRRAYGNYFGLQLGWGGALAAAIAAGAPLVALGFAGRDADTVPILRALCLFLFVQGLGSVPLTFFEAEQEIAKTIPAELGRNLCFAGLALALAIRGLGVWSIVIAHIAAAAVYSAMLWWAARGRLSLERLPEATLPLVRSSLPLMLMSLLELGVLNLDPVVLALRLPAGVVGTAGLAILAAFFVSRQLADAAGRAVYPALVRFRDQPARAFEVFRVATLFLLTLVVPVAFFAFWNAELVVAILTLGRADWQGAADYLRVAAFVPFARPLTMFGRELLLVYHRDRLLIAYTLGNLLALGGLGYVLIGTELRELGMAIAGYFPLGMLLLAWGLWQLDRSAFRRLVGNIGELYLYGLACFAPVALVPAEAARGRFAASVLAAVVFTAVALRRHRSLYRSFLAFE
jgi:O-antigen/teichoic acid export membrane protein